MRTLRTSTAVLLVLAAAVAASLAGRAAPGADETAFLAANQAWEEGRYIAALEAYLELVASPEGQPYLESIALTTGELYHTEAIATDARANGRISPDERLVAYESTAPGQTATRVVRFEGADRRVVEVPLGAVFDREWRRVAYLKPAVNGELDEQRAALQKMTPQDSARLATQQRITRLAARYASIVIRDVASGRETDLGDAGLLKTSLTWHPDGQTVYFLGGREDDVSRDDVYAIGETSRAPTRVTLEAGFKATPVVDPIGTALVYLVTPGSVFAGRSAATFVATGGAGRFAVLHLATGRATTITGTAPTFARNGSAIAWIAREGDTYSLATAPLTPGTLAVTTLRSGRQRIDAPVFSPNGRSVAFQVMNGTDWEIAVKPLGEGAEQRVTRDIQHDVLPRFIDDTRILALQGEPRHRRSYVYALDSGTRTRLFHNNTVRTLVPEYGWDLARDGSKVLITADRDGDTISPERGVYLVQLDRKVTRDELLARLRSNLASERELRARSVKTFDPIAPAVRAAVADVSTGRIYRYEKALFDFDSKNITQPGNRKAIDYLTDTYRSFGYEPEQQWFDVRAAAGGRTANVVATLRGTEDPDLVYVVSSHFDSVTAGPGADDDSSGTAALLEAARVLANRPQPATIVFASFTGEESGLLGSREWVRLAQQHKVRVVGAMNNDMIGMATDQRLDNAIRYSNDGIRDVQHAAAMLFTSLITYDTRYYRGTDAISIYDAWGDIVGGFGSYPILGNPHYHQPTDTLDTINHQLVAETSKSTVASIMLLASSPSRVTNLKVTRGAGGAADVTWTASPERSVESYVVAWGPADDPLRTRVVVREPRTSIRNVPAGARVAVKAVNRRKLESWDWARSSAP